MPQSDGASWLEIWLRSLPDHLPDAIAALIADNTPAYWPAIVAAFLIAGLVKGITGQGLPSVVLALLTVTVGLKPALALLLAPTFVTNVWQALDGRELVVILSRIWSLLAAVFVGAFLGVAMLAAADPHVMSALMGLMLCAYGAFGLKRPVFPSPGRHAVWMAPLAGLVGGTIAGMTGSLAIPGVPYMQALGFAKNTLVQGMGLLFTFSSLAVAIAMSDHRLLSPQLALQSIAGIVPALVGMWLGQQVRDRLSEAAFKTALFVSLILIGAWITGSALWR